MVQSSASSALPDLLETTSSPLNILFPKRTFGHADGGGTLLSDIVVL